MIQFIWPLATGIIKNMLHKVHTCVVCISFPFTTERYSTVWTYDILFIHSFDGHLNCFRFLAFKNNTSMHIHV
jgi:hypothetical protein